MKKNKLSKQKWKQEDENVQVALDETFPHFIIVYNDDVNTIDYVIECLIVICNHTPEQAQQCSLLIHHKGKCGVKTGSMEELIPINKALVEKGLLAKID